MLYPNPAIDGFQIEYYSTQAFEQAEVDLIDMTGRKVNNKKISLIQGNHQITFQSLPYSAGVYIVQLKANGNVIAHSSLVIHKL